MFLFSYSYLCRISQIHIFFICSTHLQPSSYCASLSMLATSCLIFNFSLSLDRRHRFSPGPSCFNTPHIHSSSMLILSTLQPGWSFKKVNYILFVPGFYLPSEFPLHWEWNPDSSARPGWLGRWVSAYLEFMPFPSHSLCSGLDFTMSLATPIW